MLLMKEILFILDINLPNPEVFCKLFEEIQRCIVVSELKILSPWKKHITIKYNYLQILYIIKIFWYVILMR